MNRSEKDKMLDGELYRPDAPELVEDRSTTAAWLARYNAASAGSTEELQALLEERIAEIGNGAVVRQPFYCDYGYNIRIGAGAFLNFNCVILDVVSVVIGDRAQIGPAVQIYAADHPRDPAARRAGLEFGRPIYIGRDAWIGGGTILLPGVTVGDDAIVGAGSVVTRDVSAGVTVAGNPARIVATHRPANIHVPQREERPMSLTLDEANRILRGALAKAQELNIKISASVCDAGGRPLAFQRMDNAIWASAYASQGKAVASAAFGRPSGDMANRADQPTPRGVAAAEGGHMIMGQGAVPIIKNGVVEGACGVSGGTAQQDEDCARAGIARL